MIRTVHQWLQLLFTGIALCLAVAFMYRIFAPGNPDTAWAFQAMHPVQEILDKICYFLTMPVDKGLAFIAEKALWLAQWVPNSIKAWFPVIPAELVAQRIVHVLLMLPHDPHGRYSQDLISARFDILFPGVVDWRLLLSLPVWSWAESLCSAIIQWIETALYRHNLRRQNKELVKLIQTQS